MRRWNGWGDTSVDYPLPDSALAFLQSVLGAAGKPKDADIHEATGSLQESRLEDHILWSTDPVVRLRHTRGQSLPDWIALRCGKPGPAPDAVAFPRTEAEVIELLTLAVKKNASLIPYGGGTSVVGHINPVKSEKPVITVDMSRMNRLIRFDKTTRLALFGAGISGPDLEAHLRAKGFTLGHFPQSFELSTLGGWVATRSSGQQSIKYGRIEKMFSGGRLVSPQGVLEIPSFPASAAGPDLREMILGSEGRLGILTEIMVRITPLPEKESFHGIFFPDFESGMLAARQIIQTGIPLSMLRLSTPSETTTTLALAGHENLIGLLEGVLSVRGLGADKCLLLAGFSGSQNWLKSARKEVLEIAKRQGGVHVGRTFGEQWHKNRFRTPYLRNTLWELGYAVDTLETAVDWNTVSDMIQGVEGALHTAIADEGERVNVFTHLSHLYPYGTSIYTTYLFRLAPDSELTLNRWKKLKGAASKAVTSLGGTISHQHGVGTDHLPYLPIEKGELGMAAMAEICRTFDPQGMMNPGKLVVDY
jgi:alkyldihydroxyacetonephosphate synthase